MFFYNGVDNHKNLLRTTFQSYASDNETAIAMAMVRKREYNVSKKCNTAATINNREDIY